MFRLFRKLFSSSSSPERQAAMAEAGKKVEKLIDTNNVVVFSKSYCPYCKATKQVLEKLKAQYLAVELDQEADGSAMQDALEQLTGQRTVPNSFIQRKHIGGNSDVQELVSSGKLATMLQEAGALKAL